MEYTPETVSKLKTLLEKIREEENQAVDFCKELDKKHQKMADGNKISEYYFDCFISVFSFDDDFCRKHHIPKGFPYYIEDSFIFWEDEETRNTNWLVGYFKSEEESMLRDLHFCYTAFGLFMELTLEDFLAMEKIMIEVSVNYPIRDINDLGLESDTPTFENLKW